MRISEYLPMREVIHINFIVYFILIANWKLLSVKSSVWCECEMYSCKVRCKWILWLPDSKEHTHTHTHELICNVFFQTREKHNALTFAQ